MNIWVRYWLLPSLWRKPQEYRHSTFVNRRVCCQYMTFGIICRCIVWRLRLRLKQGLRVIVREVPLKRRRNNERTKPYLFFFVQERFNFSQRFNLWIYFLMLWLYFLYISLICKWHKYLLEFMILLPSLLKKNLTRIYFLSYSLYAKIWLVCWDSNTFFIFHISIQFVTRFIYLYVYFWSRILLVINFIIYIFFLI